MHIQQFPAIILPKKRPLLKKILHGDEYSHHKEREHNKYLGKRGWQIWFYNWHGEAIRKFFLENESDAVELFIEIHTPGFDPRKYNIPPEEIGHVQLFITQALTSNPGTVQNFTVPATWGPNNTCSVIGGGGSSGDGAFFNSQIDSGASCGGGGGGAFASDSVTGLDRNTGLVPYFIGGISQATWFVSNTRLLADFGNTSITPINQATAIGAKGGLATNSIGAIKRNGGNGGDGGFGTNFSSSLNAAGGGGGGAGGPTSDGSNGITGGDSTNSLMGGDGGNSDTASGGTGTFSNGGNGGNGTDFDGSHGAGAGSAGGGSTNDTSAGNGGIPGNYGAGAGGGAEQIVHASSTHHTGTGNTGAQGIIFLQWTPYAYSEFYQTN